jgi:hypothetical protein
MNIEKCKIDKISGTTMLRETIHNDKFLEETLAQIKNDTTKFVRIQYKNHSLYFKESSCPDIHTLEELIAIVLKNNNFLEGRGAMVYHKTFKYLENAFDYILVQPGIFGSQQGVNNYPGVSIQGEPYCVSGFNGYNIILDKFSNEDYA